MRSPVVLLALVLALPASLSAAPQRDDAAAEPVRVISGRVVAADDSAAPLRRARITIAPTSASTGPVFSDQDGRFEIAVPDSRSCTLHISKAGFAPQEIARAAIGAADAIDVRLARGAAIVGRITDEQGRPLTLVTVMVRTAANASEPRGGSVTLSTQPDGLTLIVITRQPGLPFGVGRA
jgi:hypothetical protein